MSKYPLIERESVDKFIALVSSGTTQAVAAVSIGRDVHSLRLWMQRNGMEMPTTKPQSTITSDVMSYADAYSSGRMTQKEIASAVGCTAPYVSKLLSIHTADHIRSKEERVFKKIIAHVKENGGRAKAAARAIGVPFNSTTFYQYIRDSDIDLRPYQFANLEFGSWLVVAGPWRNQGTNYLVTALCRKCGTIYTEVNLNNLRGGRSSCCQSCSTGNTEGQLKVRCVSTGEEHKSIMSLCSSLDRSKDYQSIRHQLNKNDTVAINGNEYQLGDC